MSQKKIHARGFSESIDEVRAVRVGFKRYLRELEEQNAEVNVVENDDDTGLPDGEGGVATILDKFLGANEDLSDDARDMDSVEDGVEFLFDELRVHLERDGHSRSEVEEWMEKYDDQIFDFFYNGLT